MRRFENQGGVRHSPKLGHISHLLLAFSVGTNGEELRAITETVCVRYRRSLQGTWRGAPPVERQRTGADLENDLQTVASNALINRGLAVDASRSNFDDVAEAFERTSTIFASGG